MIITEAEGRDAIHLAVENVEAGERLVPGERIGLGPDGKAYAAPGFRANVVQGRTIKALGIVDPFLDVSFVQPGERFWLVVLPRTIRSLRHVWSHPDFAELSGAEKTGAVPTATTTATAPAVVTPGDVIQAAPIHTPAGQDELARIQAELRAAQVQLQAVSVEAARQKSSNSEDADILEAARWLRKYASDMDIDYEELMETAHDHAYGDGYSYICDGSKFEGESVPDELWDHFGTLTGKYVRREKRGSFFSCSC